MSVNFSGIVDEMLNMNMLKNKDTAPFVALLNKYGIRGVKAMEFILEFGEVAKEMGNNNAVDNTNG